MAKKIRVEDEPYIYKKCKHCKEPFCRKPTEHWYSFGRREFCDNCKEKRHNIWHEADYRK